MLTIIAAVDLENGIGKDNDLLFRIKSDLEFFKNKTLNNIVVMGSRTQESLPKKKLSNRLNYVLTTNVKESEDEEIIYTDNILDILEESKSGKDVFIIGGEMVYRELFHYADRLLITRILAVKEADRFFPRITSEFELIEESKIFNEDGIEFYFETWERA